MSSTYTVEKKFLDEYKFNIRQGKEITLSTKLMNNFQVVSNPQSARLSVKAYRKFTNSSSWSSTKHVDNYERATSIIVHVCEHAEYWEEDLYYHDLFDSFSDILSTITDEVISYLTENSEWIPKLKEYIPVLKELSKEYDALSCKLEVLKSYEGEQDELHFKITVSENIEPIDIEVRIINSFIERFPNENFDFFSIGVWRE